MESPSHDLIREHFGVISEEFDEIEFRKSLLSDAKEWVCLVSEANEAHAEWYVMFFTFDLKFLKKFKIQARLVNNLLVLGKYAIVVHEQPDGLSVNATVYSSNPPYNNIYHGSYTVFIHDKTDRCCNIKCEKTEKDITLSIAATQLQLARLCLLDSEIYCVTYHY